MNNTHYIIEQDKNRIDILSGSIDPGNNGGRVGIKKSTFDNSGFSLDENIQNGCLIADLQYDKQQDSLRISRSPDPIDIHRCKILATEWEIMSHSFKILLESGELLDGILRETARNIAECFEFRKGLSRTKLHHSFTAFSDLVRSIHGIERLDKNERDTKWSDAKRRLEMFGAHEEYDASREKARIPQTFVCLIQVMINESLAEKQENGGSAPWKGFRNVHMFFEAFVGYAYKYAQAV
jgi:CRISPR/Cas system CSM-associated protein Csm2 small subunit